MELGNGMFGEPGGAPKPRGAISAIVDEVEDNGLGSSETNLRGDNNDVLEGSILGNGSGEPEAIDYDEFSLPEGIDVDKNILAIASEQFRTLGLSQKQAQGIVDLSPQITESIRNAQQKEWDITTSNWAREIRNDKEIGGSNYKSSISKAERALRRFDFSGKLKEFLVSTKAGNNPDLIRFLVNVDSSMSESSLDRMPPVKQDTQMSDAELFFPEQAKKDAMARKFI